MNFDRIRPTVDVDRMQQSHATIVGGAYGLTQDLVRCGLGSMTYVDFDRIWSWPKPAQRPHPPIIVGGNGKRVLERVVAYGDEWMPNRIESVDELRARIDELERMAADAGREKPKVSAASDTLRRSSRTRRNISYFTWTPSWGSKNVLSAKRGSVTCSGCGFRHRDSPHITPPACSPPAGWGRIRRPDLPWLSDARA